MKKGIRHIWRYLTSPHYRYWVNFITQKEMLDETEKAIIDSLWMECHPLYRIEGEKITHRALGKSLKFFNT